jgi:hypothetical protein
MKVGDPVTLLQQRLTFDRVNYRKLCLRFVGKFVIEKMFKNGLCILRNLEGKYEIYPYPVSRSYLRKLNINRDPELVHKAKVKPWGNKNPNEFVFDYPHLKGRPGFKPIDKEKGVVIDLEEEILPGEDPEPKQSSIGTQHQTGGHQMTLRSSKTIENEQKQPDNNYPVFSPNEYDNESLSSINDEKTKPSHEKEIIKRTGLQGIIRDHEHDSDREDPSQEKSGTDPEEVSLYDIMDTSERWPEADPVVEESDVVVEKTPTIEITEEASHEKEAEPEIIYSLRSRNVMRK